MIYKFLTTEDINTAIRADLLLQFAESETELQKYIKISEAVAIQKIKSKIADRYDTDKIFVPITQWIASKQYNEGEFIYHNQIIYIVVENNTGSEPNETSTAWHMNDPRPLLVVSYCVDITLFLLHGRINPRKIPELRKDAYEEAIDYFEMLKKGEESPPDLPFLEEGEEYIPWGSSPQIDHIY